MEAVQIEGKDNNGNPRQDYADCIAGMDDEKFFEECKLKIWLSAYAGNNPRSDYHWHADACHDEAKRRGNPMLYADAHARVSADA